MNTLAQHPKTSILGARLKNSQQVYNVGSLAPSVTRLGGGLFESVRQITLQTAFLNEAVFHVFSFRDEYVQQDLPVWENMDVRLFDYFGPRFLSFSPAYLPALLDVNADILHCHGIWQYPSIACLLWHLRTGRPYIVSPHGMLEPWSIQYHHWKKRPAWFFYQKQHLQRARCLRATAESEVESFRKLGLINPVALIPNGIELPPFLECKQDKAPPYKALFLSRIHPKKGLLNLVSAWAAVDPKDWKLQIVGPDEIGHKQQVQTAVQEAGLMDCVEFVEDVWGDAKWEYYRQASLFILPSFSENFGLVIGEALGAGIPVITTTATPWGELKTHACGWWIKPELDALTDALKEATALPESIRSEMGKRGRELVMKKYGWRRIAQKMQSTLDWIIQRGPKPDFVLES